MSRLLVVVKIVYKINGFSWFVAKYLTTLISSVKKEELYLIHFKLLQKRVEYDPDDQRDSLNPNKSLNYHPSVVWNQHPTEL